MAVKRRLEMPIIVFSSKNFGGNDRRGKQYANLDVIRTRVIELLKEMPNKDEAILDLKRGLEPSVVA